MNHFDENLSKVLSDLKWYGYKEYTVHREHNNLIRFKDYMIEKGISSFSMDVAMKWCDDEILPLSQPKYRLSINRLNDVYENGRILAAHLWIFGDLSDEFQQAIDDFIESIPDYTEDTKKWYRRICSHFCLFAQLYKASGPEDINYEILRKYHCFIKEGGTYRHYETQSSNFIKYLAKHGRCKMGYAAAMFMGKFDRVFLVTDLTPGEYKNLASIKMITPIIDADSFYESIPKFRNHLHELGYGIKSSARVVSYLNWLYIFLDSAGIGYSREAACLWEESADGIVFNKRYQSEVTRSFILYDEYIQTGHIHPEKQYSTKVSYYDIIPQWCKIKVDRFINDRMREGKALSTIRQNKSHICKFCLFLAKEGLLSFDELTPEIVKKSVLNNMNLAIGTRWAYNYGVRMFLISMELRKEIREGFHFAVPHMCAEEEKIITVMDESDVKAIDAYCVSASSPMELRDAAILRIGQNTALRSIDVTSLKLSDIDWKNRMIRVIQSKTKVEHIHPVDVDTLNLIYRYLRDGRPKSTKCSNVFVTSRVPFGPLGTGACIYAMKRAGSKVTQFHCLRRTYATDTLRAGATIAETAELLGQADTNSLNRYTVLDNERMKLCPLSISEMNIPLEGRYDHV